MTDDADEKAPGSALVDAAWLAERYGLRPRVVRLWGRTGANGFPAPLRLGRAVVRWRMEDVLAWEESRAEAR